MSFIELLQKPWPWYVAGPLIGLTVPTLLIIGNKSFGISSSLRHVCAICVPSKIPFFNYDWKKEIWNLFFVVGIFFGGLIALFVFQNDLPISIHPELKSELASYGITEIDGLMPSQIFSWGQLFSIKGIMIMVMGGIMIGFGTRYAGGCTSGHSIMGLSSLQRSSLIATIFFMIGGFVMANLILPYILSL